MFDIVMNVLAGVVIFAVFLVLTLVYLASRRRLAEMAPPHLSSDQMQHQLDALESAVERISEGVALLRAGLVDVDERQALLTERFDQLGATQDLLARVVAPTFGAEQ